MSGYDLSDCPDLTPYVGDIRPDHPATADPALLRDDLLGAVREAIEAHPRSAQREIGPSEIGTPCNRRLAYKFADVAAVGLAEPPWRQAVGTAVHDHFSDYLHRYNEQHGVRFLTDIRVWIGDLYPGRPITGHLDALDLWTATIIDLKVSSKSMLDATRSPTKDNGPQYEIQIDSYGVGATNLGFPVRNVGILRVPASGRLSEAVWKGRPHDPGRARRALSRAGGIARLVDSLGAGAAAMQPTTAHYCAHCPWMRPGSTDIARGCPGDPVWLAERDARPDPITQLIA